MTGERRREDGSGSKDEGRGATLNGASRGTAGRRRAGRPASGPRVPDGGAVRADLTGPSAATPAGGRRGGMAAAAAGPRRPPAHRARRLTLLAALLLLLASTTAGEPEPAVDVQTMLPPEFDRQQSPNVTARVNGSALLTCRIRNVGSRQVSWGRSLELLTTGQIAFAGDGRFQPLHQPETEDWALSVRGVQPGDAGSYFCQVSTTPPVSHYISLTVVEPQVEIVGGPELYINRGSTANLTCIIRKAHKVPKHVRWTHDNKLVQFDEARNGVNVKIAYERDHTISFFSIERVRPSDSGEYYCDPDGLSQVKVTLHVLNGEHPAAMQTGGVGQAAAPALLLLSASINLYSACCAV